MEDENRDNKHDLKINAELLAKYLFSDPEMREEIFEEIAKDTGLPIDKVDLILKSALKVLRDAGDESARLN
ncbi:MAG: hypothetical protein U0V02_15220 [Anaerolineales bacterium]